MGEIIVVLFIYLNSKLPALLELKLNRAATMWKTQQENKLYMYQHYSWTFSTTTKSLIQYLTREGQWHEGADITLSRNRLLGGYIHATDKTLVSDRM